MDTSLAAHIPEARLHLRSKISKHSTELVVTKGKKGEKRGK